jgi:hypothetical protein
MSGCVLPRFFLCTDKKRMVHNRSQFANFWRRYCQAVVLFMLARQTDGIDI